MAETKQNSYAQIEKELLAIVFAIELFNAYLYANLQVTVETSHRPLIVISKKVVWSALKRLLLQLQRFIKTAHPNY